VIEENLHIHDKYRFEIKLGYDVDGGEAASSYAVDTYIFIPDMLGINRHTLSKGEFYNDIQAYVRLKTPAVSLDRIVTGDRSPFVRLERHVNDLLEAPSGPAASRFEYQVKLFCCIVKSSLRDHVRHIAAAPTARDREDLSARYIEAVGRLTAAFRALRSRLNVPSVDKKTFAAYCFADEYVSLLVESFTYGLLETCRDSRRPIPQTLRGELLALIDAEVAFRKAYSYPSITDSQGDNEALMFRKSVLKKYTGRALFLNTQVRKEGEMLEQGIYALAAGIAMLFATLVALSFQYTFGTFTIPFVVAVVVGYIFKDRLKDWVRIYLAGKLHKLLYDRKTSIHSGQGEKIGWCKESVDFIRERHIPEMVMRLRNRDHITEIESDWQEEKTILYRKRVVLLRDRFMRTYGDLHLESINDIMRFNIQRLLANMDDPQKGLFVRDGESYRSIRGERVYHLNMITRYSTAERSVYRRFRIILNRDGIKRIEEVVAGEEAAAG